MRRLRRFIPLMFAFTAVAMVRVNVPVLAYTGAQNGLHGILQAPGLVGLLGRAFH